mmetsp:Transcript_94755/g.187735  ORF Transcript_94755/g.187735 Transcript_94755/m.187735 type:complete len:235 (+) Transcript_94755:289-993(+)
MHGPTLALWRSPQLTPPQFAASAGVDGCVRIDRGVFGASRFSFLITVHLLPLLADCSCFCGGVVALCSSTVRGPKGVGSRTRCGGCGTELVPEHEAAAPAASQPWLLVTGAKAGVGLLHATSGCNSPSAPANDSALVSPEGGSHNPVLEGFAEEAVMAAAAEARRVRTCIEEPGGIAEGAAIRSDDVCKLTCVSDVALYLEADRHAAPDVRAIRALGVAGLGMRQAAPGTVEYE